ncbi:glycosyltransferase family 2 protein [Segatella bryantii]|uniref:glycosyltransferase family 2 protein n=1 Tax=Segatella bryantii TaxID=77095 RepID=UPI002479E01B|nr:glycosyltransferase [Segatella bryantii]
MEKKSPFISIIIPIYRVQEKFLRQCIESCINQTLLNIEIILVDDGSPDNCGTICDEYASTDNRIKVIHKENGGLVSARNCGYEAITGVWHMYLDGDDWIDDNTCEQLQDIANKHKDVDVLFWNCIQELGNKSIKGKWGWPCEEELRIYENDECKELSYNVLIYKSGIATAYSKLIKTSYARHYGIRHDDRLKQGLEGTEFSLRVFYHATKAMFLKKYYNHYIFNPESISKRIDENNTKHGIDCLNVIYEDIMVFKNQEAFLKALYQRTVYALIAFAMNTYYHPNNPDNVFKATRKFVNVIQSSDICGKAIRNTHLRELDKLRRIVLFFMKFNLYPLIKPIAIVKHKLLSKGYYNY